MSILAKHLAFVKDQAEFHDKMVEKFSAASFRGSLHKSTAEKFRALYVDLEGADKALDSPSTQVQVPSKGIQLSLSVNDIEGLPEELLSELSLTDADKTEFAIVNAIEEGGGIISLDRLLIALYKKTGEVHKRTSLYSRLARMANKNAIYYVPGKKGVYSTEQLSNEDALRIFGTVKSEQE